MIASIMSHGHGRTIEDPTRDPIANPFLVLQVTDDDRGETSDFRQLLPNFVNRTPSCVKWEDDGVTLSVSNLGLVASDLIKIEHQFVYCTFAGHGVAQGFSLNHAVEIDGNSKDSHFFLQFVPALSVIHVKILYPLEPTNVVSLRNLYFRARVSTLWNPIVEIADWDFRSEVNVVESTKIFV